MYIYFGKKTGKKFQLLRSHFPTYKNFSHPNKATSLKVYVQRPLIWRYSRSEKTGNKVNAHNSGIVESIMYIHVQGCGTNIKKKGLKLYFGVISMRYFMCKKQDFFLKVL